MQTELQNQGIQFLKWMGPLLDCLRESGGQAKPRAASEWIARKLKLGSDVTEPVLASTGDSKFHNQVAWARQYLVFEGLIDGSRRGVWTLTPEGLKTRLSYETARDLFKKWTSIHAKARMAKQLDLVDGKPGPSDVPPDEVEEADLVQTLRSLSSAGFERLCQRILSELGFESVEVTGKPFDRGIDGQGFLPLNPLISLKVIFQCKKWEGSVPGKEVGNLRNAMSGRADKGIFFTTGRFTSEARIEAKREGVTPVELIDMDRLVEILQKTGLGLTRKTVFDVDSRFFEQFRT